jgi:hypothetical protein
LVAERNAWLEDIENAELSIMQNGYVDLTLTSNARWDRESEDYPYSLDTDIKGLTIAVNEAKEMYYSGHTYYLPIVKGKAKKLKNKRVRVYADKYEVDDIGIWRTFAVLATNIEVLK